MKRIKQIFPSRNYITIDTKGDCEVIFNPTNDGFSGDDKLTFRRGRWAFRVNDFLSGKMLPDGKNEGMNRKIYSLNLIYDDEDGEPEINTTYVDPTSVIPLDGSLVEIGGQAFKDLTELVENIYYKNVDLVSNTHQDLIGILNNCADIKEKLFNLYDLQKNQIYYRVIRFGDNDNVVYVWEYDRNHTLIRNYEKSFEDKSVWFDFPFCKQLYFFDWVGINVSGDVQNVLQTKIEKISDFHYNLHFHTDNNWVEKNDINAIEVRQFFY